VLRPAAAQNLLRISCTAAHTEKHLDRLLSTLERVSNALESSGKCGQDGILRGGLLPPPAC